MEQELETKFVTMIDYLQESLSKTEGFVMEQAPLVVQEYVNYTFYSSVAFLLAVVAFFILSAIWLKISIPIFNKALGKYNEGTCGPIFISWAAMGILSIMFILTSFSKVDDLIKTIAAPRVLILEKVESLIK